MNIVSEKNGTCVMVDILLQNSSSYSYSSSCNLICVAYFPPPPHTQQSTMMLIVSFTTIEANANEMEQIL